MQATTRTAVRAPDVRRGTAADDGARDEFVAAHEEGTFFHLAGWRRAVERAFGHRSWDLLAWRDGRLVGVLPLMRCPTLRGGSNLISMPYAVYGGPLAVDEETRDALVRAAIDEAQRAGVGRLELRTPRPLPAALGLAGSDLYATYGCSLPDDPEAVLPRIPRHARAEVRKGYERFGLELVEDEAFADALVDLFHSSKQALGSPGLPRRWFAALRAELPGHLHYHAVRRQGATLAIYLSFVFKRTIHVYYMGVDAGPNREFSASNFACAALQKWAVERGLAHYDYGRSRVGSGAASFKKNQGLTAEPLGYGYHLVRAKDLPSFHPSNPKTEILQRNWRRLPGFAARGLSAVLARYLP